MASKGGKREGSGRPKGAENKATKDIRASYKLLLENNLGNLQEWIDRIAENNPAKAIELLNSMSEYIIPKLQRTELVGDKDKPIIWKEMKSYKEDDSNPETNEGP